ncbi:SAVED domain-containing protein [Streptomyces sp. NPDC051563]|uniref:SAVED domain-containing protein n=1 Tax=Streptomyces sp. NPDC051563 TaxID=3365659 RepID=UPI0037A52E39
MEPLPAPSPTSVRITGDHYQWLIAWTGCLTLLRENAIHAANPVISVGVEADDAGNLDDVVLLRCTPPHTYVQVKYTVSSATPVNEEYLTKPSPTGGPSILKKIARTWRTLTADGIDVDLAIITNRAPDPNDPLIAVRDSRTQLLLPKAADGTARSKTGKARTRWAENAGLSEIELHGLLSCLRFDVSRELPHVQEQLQLLMAVSGLRHDSHAVDEGANWVAQQVRDGHRTLTLDMIRAAVDSLNLKTGPARAILSIATLKPDLLAHEADHTINWVERFETDSEYTKRRPLAPSTWTQLQEEIEAAPAHLLGSTNISVTGSIRLAPAFLTGAAFRMVSGADLAVLQRGQLWSTSDTYDADCDPIVEEHDIGYGEDLAVGINVTVRPADFTQDVVDYLREQNIPASKLLILTPPAGPNDGSVSDSHAANALAVGIRDALRRPTRTTPRIHLFLACPMGLALLLGHRWNRLRPTVVYEDVRTAQGYEPAFVIPA